MGTNSRTFAGAVQSIERDSEHNSTMPICPLWGVRSQSPNNDGASDEASSTCSTNPADGLDLHRNIVTASDTESPALAELREEDDNRPYYLQTLGYFDDKDKRTTKIFVGGLPSNLTLDDFKAFFAAKGEVVDATMLWDKETLRHRGFGFVVFKDEETVEQLVKLQYLYINNKAVEVKKAKPKEDMFPTQRVTRTLHQQQQQQDKGTTTSTTTEPIATACVQPQVDGTSVSPTLSNSNLPAYSKTTPPVVQRPLAALPPPPQINPNLITPPSCLPSPPGMMQGFIPVSMPHMSNHPVSPIGAVPPMPSFFQPCPSPFMFMHGAPQMPDPTMMVSPMMSFPPPDGLTPFPHMGLAASSEEVQPISIAPSGLLSDRQPLPTMCIPQERFEGRICVEENGTTYYDITKQEVGDLTLTLGDGSDADSGKGHTPE